MLNEGQSDVSQAILFCSKEARASVCYTVYVISFEHLCILSDY